MKVVDINMKTGEELLPEEWIGTQADDMKATFDFLFNEVCRLVNECSSSHSSGNILLLCREYCKEPIANMYKMRYTILTNEVEGNKLGTCVALLVRTFMESAFGRAVGDFSEPRRGYFSWYRRFKGKPELIFGRHRFPSAEVMKKDDMWIHFESVAVSMLEKIFAN